MRTGVPSGPTPSSEAGMVRDTFTTSTSPGSRKSPMRLNVVWVILPAVATISRTPSRGSPTRSGGAPAEAASAADSLAGAVTPRSPAAGPGSGPTVAAS